MSVTRKSRPSSKNQKQDSDQEFQINQERPSEQHSDDQESGKRTRKRPKRVYNEELIFKNHQNDNQQEQDLLPQNTEKDENDFLTPKIQCLLAMRIRKLSPREEFNQNGQKKLNCQMEVENKQEQQNEEKYKTEMKESKGQNQQNGQNQEEEQFLVKIQGRSYLRVKWMTRDQIADQTGAQVTNMMIKSMRLKLKKLSQLKLSSEHYFNPNFTKTDRILSSTQIFTAIHHKKANQIKGKWDQSLMLVCSKLLNFMKEGYPYGVHFHEPYIDIDSEEEYKKHNIQNQTNLGQILNRIYLSQFRSNQQFWQEVGRSIRQYFQIFSDKQTDQHRVGVAIMQCSMFLYEQWYHLCKQRYNSLRNEMIESNMIQGLKSDQILDNEESPSSKEVGQDFQQIDINKFCKINIFMTQKIVEPPKTRQQLQLLNPGTFSFAWLQENTQQKNLVDLSNADKTHFDLDQEQTKYKRGDKFLNYQYQELDFSDMKNLDLNIEVDKIYLVKWKDLSYQQCSWETESLINNNDKIQQFKNWNKIPNRQTRQKVQIHNKIHKFLLQYYQTPQSKMVKNPNVAKMQKKIYLLDGSQSEVRQYGGKDIPIFKNYRMLKQFQLQSLNWLIKNWYQNRNCILADEMGLGKTIQTIAFLYHLHTYQGVLGPFLVLAPLTTLPQWRRQIQEWTEFNCLLYYDEGASDARNIIQNYQFFHLHTTKNGDIIPSKIPKFQVLLTNYELFINDFQNLKKIPFQHMILDEAHRLKNRRSNTTKVLSQLPCYRKTLLTGTPLQNNTKQLWTLLNFIDPRTFISEQAFLGKFGSLNSEQQVKDFKRMLKPYLLRRVKQDVQKTIPQLYEMIIDVQMTKKQKQVYRGLLQKNKNQMIRGLSSANFNSIAIQLRKCCNHPFLISHELEQEITKQFHNQHEAFLKSSGKMLLLMKLLKKFKNQGKKVLLFSQFVIMIDLIKIFLEQEGYNVEVLKGSLSGTTRHQAITRFNQDSSTDIFLISTKAGGVGINLITATQIIIYDSDWNPQNDIQATARAHRIGQKKEVTVYRLITANTYQSQMFQISSKKLGLDKAVFNGQCFKNSGQFNEAEKQMSKQQIQMLLKKGVLGFLENNKSQDEYFNQTIEDILQKNARKVEYSMNPNSTAYSKTKFVAEEGQNDISIDAPDFWQRALKGVETPIDKLCKKADNLKDFQKVQDQQALMIEAYHLIFQFVKNKTVGTGFNHQDERHLIKFLQTVSGERKFHRNFRDIANTFLQQIEKPSRRFRVKYQDLMVINPEIKKVIEKPKSRISRLTRKKKSEFDLGSVASQSNENDQISDVQSENDDAQQQNQQKEDKQDKDEEDTQNKYIQDFQKLCSMCKKPKCSIFCNGVCGRGYHKKCFEKILSNDDTSPSSNQIEQAGMNFEDWKNQIIYGQKCMICMSETYYFPCQVCKIEGLYKPEIITKKKKKEQQTQDNPNQIYKCSIRKCFKFYHLKCLYKKQFKNKFAYSGGKIVGDIQITSNMFRCPSHYCYKCYGTEDVISKLKTTQCFKCPKSYHQKKCRPKTFLKIMDGVYLCGQHLAQQKITEQDMKKQYQPFKSKHGSILSYLKSAKNKKNKDDLFQQVPKVQKKKNKKLQKQKETAQTNTISTINEENTIQGSESNKLKQPQNGKKKSKTANKIKYSYLDFGLTPIPAVNYEEYPNVWCRYCGSRYAKGFKDGPWGKKTLCVHHYQLWKSKRITIPQVQNPKEPIHKDKETEIKYLNEYYSAHSSVPVNKITQILDSFRIKDNQE